MCSLADLGSFGSAVERTPCTYSKWRTSHAFPSSGTRIVARLFRADGDHITDVKVPAFNRPAEIVLWHFRVFQYKGSDAAGLPVYFEAFAYTVPEAA